MPDRNTRPSSRAIALTGVIVGWCGLLGCTPAEQDEHVQLTLRQLPGCEVGASDSVWLQAQGDFATLERRLDVPSTHPADDLPLATEWLALDLRDAEPRAGGLVAVHGRALARDVLVLPLGRSCPLGDSAAMTAHGASVVALEDGGLLIAGGDYMGHAATAAARWLPPGATLMREVEGGMLLRRSGASATRVGDQVFVAGGAADDRGAAHDTFEVYVASAQRFDNARSGKLSAGPRRDHGALALGDGRVLLAGGRVDLESEALGSLELIGVAPAQTAGELQIARIAPALLQLDSGALLVALGTTASGALVTEVERLDLNGQSSQVVASLPSYPYAAVTALEGERVAQLGCSLVGACELSLLLPQADGFALVPALDASALAVAGVVGLTSINLRPLRDGRLLIAAAASERAKPSGFVVDLSSAAIERVDLTRGPGQLLELVDGTVAELDGSGLSLLRMDLIDALDDAPDPLSESAPLRVALDSAEHWQRDDQGLLALTAARWDLPQLRFSALRVELTMQGTASLLLEPEAAPPLRIELGEDALALGACSVPRADADPVRIERRAGTLLLHSPRGERRCDLPATLGRVGLALEAQAGTRLSQLTLERL